MDNCATHKSDALREVIEAAGRHLVFLPPYSVQLKRVLVAVCFYVDACSSLWVNIQFPSESPPPSILPPLHK